MVYEVISPRGRGTGNIVGVHTESPQCIDSLDMPIYFRDISPINDPTGVYLNEIYRRVEFKQWFCGHMHRDVDKPMYKLRVLYSQVAEVNTKECWGRGEQT